MTLSHFNTRQLRELLRYLIVAQLISVPVIIVADLTFPPPEEISAANELIAENDQYVFSGLQVFLFLSTFVPGIILGLWSMWQLYRFDVRGLRNALLGSAIVLFSCLIAPQGTGGWSSLQSTALSAVTSIAYGLVIAVCLLKPEIFKTQDKVGEGSDAAVGDQAPVSVGD